MRYLSYSNRVTSEITSKPAQNCSSHQDPNMEQLSMLSVPLTDSTRLGIHVIVCLRPLIHWMGEFREHS
jgi:hypothetical protein